jgi:hypothetical protein
VVHIGPLQRRGVAADIPTPSSGWMKPKPRWQLYNFTVPVALATSNLEHAQHIFGQFGAKHCCSDLRANFSEAKNSIMTMQERNIAKFVDNYYYNI